MPVLLVKQRISVSEPPFGGLTGNTCDSSLAGWKACSQLPDALRLNRLLLKGVGQFGAKY